jgi:hypothetical protein
LDKECFEREKGGDGIAIGETNKGKVCVFGWIEMRRIHRRRRDIIN